MAALFPPHHVKFVIGSHRCEIRHPVGHPEKRGDAYNVPYIIIREAMAMQCSEVFFIHGVCFIRHLQGKLQHRHLSQRNIRLSIVDRHLIRNRRLFRTYSEDRPMRDVTILATITAGNGDDNHFSLSLRQSAVPQHQGVMIGHKCTQFVWTVGQNQKTLGTKPTFSCTDRIITLRSSGRSSIYGTGNGLWVFVS